ncbi:MAG TPA: TOBE domain-containing protein, partial [Gemmatimonadales bacterium]|nr:TOBE domain-containing protein [Gemmatimonadales bacterium]
ISFRVPDNTRLKDGAEVHIAVRPECMDICRTGEVPPTENALIGTIGDIIYLGETIHVVVAVPQMGNVKVAVRNEGQLLKPLAWKRGEAVAVVWLPEECQILEG